MPAAKSTATSMKISITDIESARERLAGLVIRTPLLRLDLEDAPAEVYLKLETLQPTGSFKVRGAGNAISLLAPADRQRGVYTCSAGNMAQALAWHARRLGIPCTVIMPDTAPQTKLAGVRRFGALIGGIATAIKARRSRTNVYACEPETAAPLAASFAAGSPQEFKRIPSFVDGSGASSVLPEMWDLNRPLLAGSIVVSLREVASAIKLLVERHH